MTGVTPVVRNGIHQWQAQLSHKGTNYYLGTHADAETAARAYDAKARALGWLHKLNFPELKPLAPYEPPMKKQRRAESPSILTSFSVPHAPAPANAVITPKEDEGAAVQPPARTQLPAPARYAPAGLGWSVSDAAAPHKVHEPLHAPQFLPVFHNAPPLEHAADEEGAVADMQL